MLGRRPRNSVLPGGPDFSLVAVKRQARYRATQADGAQRLRIKPADRRSAGTNGATQWRSWWSCKPAIKRAARRAAAEPCGRRLAPEPLAPEPHRRVHAMVPGKRVHRLTVRTKKRGVAGHRLLSTSARSNPSGADHAKKPRRNPSPHWCAPPGCTATRALDLPPAPRRNRPLSRFRAYRGGGVEP